MKTILNEAIERNMKEVIVLTIDKEWNVRCTDTFVPRSITMNDESFFNIFYGYCASESLFISKIKKAEIHSTLKGDKILYIWIIK